MRTSAQEDRRGFQKCDINQNKQSKNLREVYRSGKLIKLNRKMIQNFSFSGSILPVSLEYWMYQ